MHEYCFSLSIATTRRKIDQISRSGVGTEFCGCLQEKGLI